MHILGIPLPKKSFSFSLSNRTTPKGFILGNTKNAAFPDFTVRLGGSVNLTRNISAPCKNKTLFYSQSLNTMVSEVLLKTGLPHIWATERKRYHLVL